MDAGLLNKRLFLEAEFPFFMLDTQQYPTTVQGDSIVIAQELFNKYRPSLNETYFPRSSPTEEFPFKHYYN